MSARCAPSVSPMTTPTGMRCPVVAPQEGIVQSGPGPLRLPRLCANRYRLRMVRSANARRLTTLASLAAELGVSRTTVSNAYNRPDQLSPELRERVLETARRLRYPVPDPVARSLRTRCAGAIGLLLTEGLSYAFRDPAAVGFLEGFALACEEAEQGLLLVPASPDADQRSTAATVHQAGVDGFVVYSVPRTTRTSRPCCSARCPPWSATSRRSTGWTTWGSTTMRRWPRSDGI